MLSSKKWITSQITDEFRVRLPFQRVIAGLSRLSGIKSRTPIPKLGALESSTAVVLVAPENENYLNILESDRPEQAILLNLMSQALETLNGRYRLFRNFSYGSNFDWWFLGDSGVIHLVAAPNASLQRYEGHLTRYRF